MPNVHFSQLPDSPLVSTAWLAETIETDPLGNETHPDHLVILDATVLQVPGFKGGMANVSGEEEYLVKGHIPGAIFADLLEDFSDPEGEFKLTRPTLNQFEAAAKKIGVDDDSTVVIYDTGIGNWAARLWWIFRSFGVQARVLDGGFKRWLAENRPVELGAVTPRHVGGLTATDNSERYWVDKNYVTQLVEGSLPGTLVCGLPPKEYSGEVSPRPRAGHIPGSHNVPAGRVVDHDTNLFLSPEQLRELFGEVISSDSVGADSPDAAPVVTYCGAGVAAASDALALTIAGLPAGRVLLYDNSLNEWAANPDAPLVTA